MGYSDGRIPFTSASAVYIPVQPTYYMTGDLCMKTLHTDKDQPADQSKRPRESPVEYVWKKETRRVDGPDEQRKLEEGEWELAEWVRYIKNKYV